MWPRVIEMMLGLWITISPFVFRHPPDQRALWIHDITVGFAVTVLALLSFWRPLRRAHLLLLGVGGWLLYFGYTAATAGLPAHQNHIILGLLLPMFAILPNEANAPSETWRDQGTLATRENEK